MPVYFIKSLTGHIKIGRAADVARRLVDIQTANPLPVELLVEIPGDIIEERLLHTMFDHCHFRGEWYLPSRELLDFIDDQQRTVADGGVFTLEAIGATGRDVEAIYA